NAANYVSEKAQGTGAQASKETNKSIAKDGNVPIGTRFRAAGDMVSDKMDQHSHEARPPNIPTEQLWLTKHAQADAKVHKEQAKQG
ncbi:MAG: hypothetical protein Q9171_007382, partial [Xanthocarpia ochracea]